MLQACWVGKSMILQNGLFSIFYDSEDIYKSTDRRLCRWRQQYSWNYVNTSQSYGVQTFNLKLSNTLDLIRELLVSLFHLSTQPVPLSQLNIGHVWPRLLLPCLKVRSVYENFIKNISEGLRRRCLGQSRLSWLILKYYTRSFLITF